MPPSDSTRRMVQRLSIFAEDHGPGCQSDVWAVALCADCGRVLLETATGPTLTTLRLALDLNPELLTAALARPNGLAALAIMATLRSRMQPERGGG